MALMGYRRGIEECSESKADLEAYTNRLEQELRSVRAQRDQWIQYARDIENRRSQLRGKVDPSRVNIEELLEELEAIRVERNQLVLYARELKDSKERADKVLEEANRKVRRLEESLEQTRERYQDLVRDVVELKKVLVELLGEHGTELLTPLGLKHRDTVLRFIKRLPDGPVQPLRD